MLTKNERLGLRTWIEIDRGALKHNIGEFKKLLKPEIKFMAVVKSNAYGHGLVEYSKEIDKYGTDWFAVDSIVEALRLRKEGIEKPILVLGYTLPEKIQDAVSENISVTVSSLYMLNLLKDLELTQKLRVHIKIDSGMHRQGFLESEQQEVIDFLKSHGDKITVEGLYTHFAAAKDPKKPESTLKQNEIFNQWIQAFKQAGFSPVTHAAASGATILFPETHHDMVRVGIGLHGLWPSEEVANSMQDTVSLQPTLSWKTIIGELKKLSKGEKIGYDFTEELSRDSLVAVCPIGYWHGFTRSLSSIGTVLVQGVRAKVLGRVSMDMITVDVTDVPNINIGDKVVLIGKSGDIYLGAHEVAAIANVSTYEFVTRINPLIKKFYIDSKN